MNRVLVLSVYGEFLPIAQRMEEEGTEVYVYLHETSYKHRYDGMLKNKIDISQIIAKLKKVDHVIIDITTHSRQKPHDLKLLSKFGIKSTEKDLFGSIADRLKRPPYDVQVIGASRQASQLEWDREYGIEIARKCGLDIPNYQVFKNVQDGVKFLGSREAQQNRWVMKPWDDKDSEWTYAEKFPGEMIDVLQTNILRKFGNNFQFMLQEFIEGVEYATEQWQDLDNKPRFYTRTCENKKLMDGNKGKATGSQENLYWIPGKIDERMANAFKKGNKLINDGFIGMWDINAIYKDDKCYFLEHTRRFGWSSTYLCCRLVPEGALTTFFLKGFNVAFKHGFVSSQVISLFPYPAGNNKELTENIKDNLINHKLSALKPMFLQDAYFNGEQLRVAGCDGMIGIMTGMGDTPESSVDDLFKNIDKFQVTGSDQYRTKPDHLEMIKKRLDKLKKWGVELW